jgi:hypothetical protein
MPGEFKFHGIGYAVIGALVGGTIAIAPAQGRTAQYPLADLGYIPKPKWVAQSGPGLPPAAALVGAIRGEKPVQIHQGTRRLSLSNPFLGITFQRQTGRVIQIRSGGSNVLQGASVTTAADTPFVVDVENRKGLHYFSQIGPVRPETLAAFSVRTQVRKLSNGGAMVVVKGHNKSGVRIEYWVVLLPGQPLSYWRMRVENNNPQDLVNKVVFPQFTGLVVGKHAANNWFTFPIMLGAKIKAQGIPAGKTLQQILNERGMRGPLQGSHLLQRPVTPRDRYEYPMDMHMQWLSLYQRGYGQKGGRGFYVACDDNYTYIKNMDIGEGKDHAGIMKYTFPGVWITPHSSWTTPWFSVAYYPNGGWRQAARWYRDWAEKVGFKPPAHVPPIIRQMPAMNWSQWYVTYKGVQRRFETQQAGPVSGIIYDFMGGDNFPDMDLRGNTSDIRHVNKAISRLGGIPCFYICPWLMYQGYTTFGGSQYSFVRFRNGAVAGGWGDTWPDPANRRFVELWCRKIQRLVGTLKAGGVTWDVGGGAAGPNYNPRRTYRPDLYPYYAKEFFKAVRRTGQKYNPGFTISTEHCADYYASEFARSSAHIYEFKTVSVPKGVQGRLMPVLFRYTLPSISALQYPTECNADFWMYGYGPGYGFLGGGPSWGNDPNARASNYTFYNLPWYLYYRWRVGFMDAVVDGKVLGENVRATVGKKSFQCEFPRRLVACSFLGTGRQITLGGWFDLNPSAYGQALIRHRWLLPEKVTLAIQTPLANVHKVYLHKVGQLPRLIKFHQQGDTVYVTVSHPDYFAVEMIDHGIHPQFNLPTVAYEGRPLTIKLALTNWTAAAARGSVRLDLPVGWRIPQEAAHAASAGFRPGKVGSTSRHFAIPVGMEAVLTFQVNVPHEPMQRTYPLHAVIRLSDGRKLYTAATVRVMKRCYLHVAHPILSLGAKGQATATFVNNLPVPVRIRARVAAPVGMVVAPSSFEIHLGPASFQRRPVMLKTSLGAPAVATTKLMNPRQRQILRIQTEKTPLSGAITLHYFVQAVGGQQAWRKIYSWTPAVKLLSLAKAAWKTKLFPSIFRGQGHWGVMGIGGRDSLPLPYITPVVSDANWPTMKVGQAITLPKDTVSSVPYNKRAGYGIFRTWINVPRSWMKYRRIKLHGVDGAPVAWFSHCNYIFINGRPAGMLGNNGSIEIAPYLYYGGKNLIAIAQYTPTGIPRLSIVAGSVPPARERAFKVQNGE